jgi:hypothetical protein
MLSDYALPLWTQKGSLVSGGGDDNLPLSGATPCKVGENHMSELLECRERLESAHKQMQDAMVELITNKNYSEAERLLYVVDKLMLDLIDDMGGTVIRSGVWT